MKKLADIKSDYHKSSRALDIEYALSTNSIQTGDKIKDKIGTATVIDVNVKESELGHPICVYLCSYISERLVNFDDIIDVERA